MDIVWLVAVGSIGVILTVVAVFFTISTKIAKATEETISKLDKTKQKNKNKLKKKEKSKSKNSKAEDIKKDIMSARLDDEEEEDDYVPHSSKSKQVNITVALSTPVAAVHPEKPTNTSVSPDGRESVDEPSLAISPVERGAITESAAAATAEKKKKNKETPEQKAARLERQRAARLVAAANNSPASAVDSSEVSHPPAVSPGAVGTSSSGSGGSFLYHDMFSYYPAVLHQQLGTSLSEGWVELKKEKKTKTARPSAAAAVSEGGSTAVKLELVKSSVTIDAKKVGLVVGPKGSTMQKLQEKFSVEITTPKESSSPAVLPPNGHSNKSAVATTAVVPAIVGISGVSADNVAQCIKAINELCNKGYTAALEEEGFKEGHISVPTMFISELIGREVKDKDGNVTKRAGHVRKAIQDHTGVKVVIPPNAPREQIPHVIHSSQNAPPVRVLLAGHHSKVSEAKAIIQEIMTHYHHPITHPGLVHEEMEVPSSLYMVIIGARGAEIRHIQNNFKVSVHVPQSDSLHQHVIVVGEPKNVAQACAYIQKIIDKSTQDKEAAQLAADAWAERDAETEAPAEETDWMKQYIKKSDSQNLVNLLTGERGSDEAEEDAEEVIVSAPLPPPFSSSSSSGNVASSGSTWASTVLASADGW